MTNKHLTESNVFCMAPWVHIANIPNGDILPCCISLGGSMGNLYKDKIEDIWNNDNYKSFRKDLLEGKQSKHCTRCYKEESWGNTTSYRRTFNRKYGNQYDDLVTNSTDADGNLSKMKFIRWDFRFNNLCNLACTSCSPIYSSTWGNVAKLMDPSYSIQRFNTSEINKESFINTIKTQAENVIDVYFAGGEPLIQAEHYEILDHIDSINRLEHIDFVYSTNLSVLEYKSVNILDYWKKMKSLRILVSLDEIDPDRLYYIRYPADLDKIVKNIKRLNETLTRANHDWVITPTWSIMNTHRMLDIVKFFKDNELLPNAFYNTLIWEYDVHNIILMDPPHLSIMCATPEWKEYLRTKLNEYKEWYIDVLIPLKKESVRTEALRVMDTIIARFHKSLDENVEINKDDWKRWINRLDVVRSTNFNKTFPELEWHLP